MDKKKLLEMNMEQEKKVTPAATEVTKKYCESFQHGTVIKLNFSIEVSDFSIKDLQKLLSCVAVSARQFYLSVGRKLSNTP